MKRRRTKTSSIIDALTHLEWEKLPIQDALQLFAALEEIRGKGSQAIQALARSLTPVPAAPPPQPVMPRSGLMNGQVEHGQGPAARICSSCNVPLNGEVMGPWLMNGLCQNCFDSQ